MRIGVRRLAAAAALVTGLASLGATPGGAQEADADISADAGAGEASGYIVRFADGVDPQARARGVRRRGAAVDRVYSNVFPGLAAELTDEEVAELRRDPQVISVEPDHIMTATDTQADPPWGLDRTDQRALPLSRTYSYPTSAGDGVTAYIVDTGVRGDHAQFSGRMPAGAYAIDDGYGTSDCNGHGTHVAGTVAGSTYGIAKRALVVPVRVLGCDGSGPTSGVIAGLDWIVGHHGAGQRAVANLSLGGPASSSMDAAVQRVIADGVPVVAAAGNDAVDACTQSPGRTAAAVTVGATDRTDRRSSFSNYGACLDLFAPGSEVLSAGRSSSTASTTMSGTSMAAPHIAGAIAVLWAAQPSLTAATVASRVVSDTTTNVVTDPRSGSPNRLLHLVPPPVTRPANDDLAGATAFDASVVGSAAGSNVNATKQAGEPAHAGNTGGRSVWWTFTAPASGQMTIHTTGSNFDTLLAVYTGSSVGALTLIASDDDGLDSALSTVDFAAVAGRTYRVAVDGYSGATGSVRLTWTGLGSGLWAPFPSAAAFITRQHQDLLGRPPTSSELSTWTTRLTTGTHTGAGLALDLRRGTDNTTIVDPTVRLYRGVLRRTPDRDGLEYWVQQRRSGARSLVSIADYFTRSPEFVARYGQLTNRQFVSLIYSDILERPGEVEGVNFWTAQLDTRARTRGQVLLGFTESAEYRNRYAPHVDVATAYIAMLDRRPTNAEVADWVDRAGWGTTYETLLREILDSTEYRTLVA